MRNSQITLTSKRLSNILNRTASIRMKNRTRFTVPSPRMNLESVTIRRVHRIHECLENSEVELKGMIKKLELLSSLQELEEKSLENILQSFTRVELVQIIKEAADAHPDLLVNIQSLAECDESRLKIFITCLSPKTNSEGLWRYFSRYGELVEAQVVLDKFTGKSRGFGFVTFKHVESFLRALEKPSKNIQGCVAFVSVCVGSGVLSNSTNISDKEKRTKRKIRVENVPPDISSNSLINYFGLYGEIEQGPWGFDMKTGNLRPTVYFLYKNEGSARAAVAKPVRRVKGFNLICKRVVNVTDKAVRPAITDSWESIPLPLRVFVVPVFYYYYYCSYGGIETCTGTDS